MTQPLGVVLLAAAAALFAAACGGGRHAEATITMHYSAFAPEVVTVRAGQPLKLTLRNDDPIEHEWIVGADDVHEGHRTGAEPFHAAIPTEVTVPPFSERVTTVTFDEPGDYAFICHLPGHEAYGMVGTVRVLGG